MTCSELAAIMDRNGIVASDLAMISGRTPRQVSSWLSGAFPVPRMLSLILLALDGGRIDARWLAEHLAK